MELQEISQCLSRKIAITGPDAYLPAATTAAGKRSDISDVDVGWPSHANEVLTNALTALGWMVDGG